MARLHGREKAEIWQNILSTDTRRRGRGVEKAGGGLGVSPRWALRSPPLVVTSFQLTPLLWGLRGPWWPVNSWQAAGRGWGTRLCQGLKNIS